VCKVLNERVIMRDNVTNPTILSPIARFKLTATYHTVRYSQTARFKVTCDVPNCNCEKYYCCEMWSCKMEYCEKITLVRNSHIMKYQSRRYKVSVRVRNILRCKITLDCRHKVTLRDLTLWNTVTIICNR